MRGESGLVCETTAEGMGNAGPKRVGRTQTGNSGRFLPKESEFSQFSELSPVLVNTNTKPARVVFERFGFKGNFFHFYYFWEKKSWLGDGQLKGGEREVADPRTIPPQMRAGVFSISLSSPARSFTSETHIFHTRFTHREAISFWEKWKGKFALRRWWRRQLLELERWFVCVHHTYREIFRCFKTFHN